MDSEIRKKRMADVTITVLKADKTPLINQEVIIAQTKHKFLFGTAAFDLVPLTNDEYGRKKREQTEERANKLLWLFNAVTLPFYWARFEPQRGKPMTGQLKQTARWCIDHHLKVKGHPLCWHTLTADWLLSMNNSEILQAQTARIRREVLDFRGLIEMWDVINEAIIMPSFDKYDNGITRLCREMGRINTIKAMFDAARSVDPSTGKSVLYDYKTTSLTKLLEIIGYASTFWLLGRRFRTYDAYVEDEVVTALRDPGQYSRGWLFVPHVVVDRNLVTSRYWLFDAEKYSYKFAEMVEQRLI